LGTEIAALGIDAGSTTTKIVGVTFSGTLDWHHLEPTDPAVEGQIKRFLEIARRETGSAGLPLVSTGYGRNLVQPADRRVTEITCHARGVFREMGHGGTLIDIGGQDTKIIIIDQDGNVKNFAMNDKCAAGTGRFLEVVAERLRIPLDAMGEAALSSPDEASISSTCTVFAESEIVSLIARGHPAEPIVRGLHRSLVRRISALAKTAGLTPPVMLSGGVARNAAVRQILSEELGRDVLPSRHPQLVGAYGAALIALGLPKTRQAETTPPVPANSSRDSREHA